MVTVPALLGMAKALQGCQVSRREAFWSLCAPFSEPRKEEDSWWEKLREQEGLEEEYNMTLFKVVSEGGVTGLGFLLVGFDKKNCVFV